MASGSSGNIEIMTNTPQESNLALPTSAQDPNINYVEVSPTTLLDSNRHTCEVCGKGYARKQNLSLHLRVHNLPFTLKTRTPNDPVPRKKYICPESTCIHHNRSHAIVDFGGLKKHYLRRHSTDKNYKCDICSKAYSVPADLKAHAKTCAKKVYICHCGSRFSRAKHFTTHQENCYAPDHVGAVRTMPHPQTLEIRANKNTIISNEGSNTLNGPQISFIQNQSSSYPFTTSYQSQLSQFGYGPAGDGRKSFHDGGYMHIPSSSSNLTPATHNLGLHEMFNPMTGCSAVGSYEQGGYGVGSGPLMDMLNFQHQQQPTLHNVNPQGMNVRGDYGIQVTSNFHNLTPTRHNLGENEMFNPMTGSSSMVSYEQGGYNNYGFVSGNIGYPGEVEMLNFQQQQQEPSHNVNTGDMDVHGDWGNINYGTGEGSKSYSDGSCMLDPINSLNRTQANLNLGLNDVAGSSDMGYSEQGGYKGYWQW